MSEEKKTSPQKKRARLAVISFGLLALLLGILYFGRGWIRMTAEPGVIKIIHGNPAEKVVRPEMDKLQNPLDLLGYKNATPMIYGTGCHTVLAKGIKTQVDCSYTYDLTEDIPTSGDAKQTLRTNAEKLQALLKANGWQGEYANVAEYTSLVKLATSLTDGIDYQPDATYTKKFGDVNCIFSNYTAFSKPDTPKMSTRLYCSRSFNVIGQPSWN